jgi:hypothetical protein
MIPYQYLFYIRIIIIFLFYRCYPLLGYLSQDLLGMNLKDFVHEDDRNKVTDIWNRGTKLKILI